MKKKSDEINLLEKALRLAAIDAYQNEVVDTEIFDQTIGTGKKYETVKDWLKTRTDSWLQEAELLK